MLKPRSPQASFYGSYLYDKIVPADHLLRKINQVVDFSLVYCLSNPLKYIDPSGHIVNTGGQNVATVRSYMEGGVALHYVLSSRLLSPGKKPPSRAFIFIIFSLRTTRPAPQFCLW